MTNRGRFLPMNRASENLLFVGGTMAVGDEELVTTEVSVGQSVYAAVC